MPVKVCERSTLTRTRPARCALCPSDGGAGTFYGESFCAPAPMRWRPSANRVVGRSQTGARVMQRAGGETRVETWESGLGVRCQSDSTLRLSAGENALTCGGYQQRYVQGCAEPSGRPSESHSEFGPLDTAVLAVLFVEPIVRLLEVTIAHEAAVSTQWGRVLYINNVISLLGERRA